MTVQRLVWLKLTTMFCICEFLRRQSEVVLPALFEAAKSGDVDHISEVMEEGDSVDNVRINTCCRVQ